MLIKFTAAQWTAITIAAVIDGEANPARWAHQMVLHLAGLIGPSHIETASVPHEIEEEDDGIP